MQSTTHNVLTENNNTLDEVKAVLKRHRSELHKFCSWQEEMSQHHFALDSKVNSMSVELGAKDAHIESLKGAVAELRSLVEGMQDCLCHCTEGKGKGRVEEEVKIEDVEENSMGLEYASSNNYYSPQVAGELHLIEDVPDRGVEGCCAKEPVEVIEISDSKVDTIVENEVPIRIQVECSPPQDRVVRGQQATRSHRHNINHPYCRNSHFIDGIDVRTNSGYTLTKCLERIRCGEDPIPERECVSSYFGGSSIESNSSGDNVSNHPTPKGIKPGGGGARPRSGTPEEDQGLLRSNGGRGVVRVQGGS